MALDVPFQHTSRDVDVYGERKDDVLVLECKALTDGKELSPEDVRKFYTETLPAYVRTLAKRPKNVFAEIWTTGKVGEAAQEALKSISLAANVVPVLRDGDKVRQLVPSKLERICCLLTAIALPVSIPATPEPPSPVLEPSGPF